MAVVRILVDGYSLLHAWRELVPTEPRHSARAREALIRVLTQYADSVGTPITLFFDGTGAPKGLPKTDSPDSLEIVFSRDSKTAMHILTSLAFSATGGLLTIRTRFSAELHVRSTFAIMMPLHYDPPS